jgi:hypothetical protein
VLRTAARQAKIPGFPYFFLVRLPLAIHAAFLVFFLHVPLGTIVAIAMLLCWTIQPFVVVIAVMKCRKAGASKALLPNLAIFCGCLQIAMLVWVLVGSTRDLS